MKTLIVGAAIAASVALGSNGLGLGKKLTNNLSMIQSHAHNHNSSDSSHNGPFDFNF